MKAHAVSATGTKTMRKVVARTVLIVDAMDFQEESLGWGVLTGFAPIAAPVFR